LKNGTDTRAYRAINLERVSNPEERGFVARATSRSQAGVAPAAHHDPGNIAFQVEKCSVV
jgi:hypothetical protein